MKSKNLLKKFVLSLLMMLAICIVVPEINVSASQITAGSEKGKWKEKNGKKYYYVKNKKVKGFYKIKGEIYYFDKKGVMKTGWQKISKKKYYFDSDGTIKLGKVNIGGKTYYFDKKTGVMKTGFVKISNRLYYFDKKGVMKTGWVTVSKKKYYINSKGIVQTGWKTLKGKRYYFDEKGAMQTGWTTVGNKKYYMNSKGIVQTGLKTIKGKKYYFNSKGVMLTGLREIGGKTYYFDKKSGAMVKNKTIKVNTAYYYFGADGILDTEKSYCMVNGYKMHIQYMTDPEVSDETLLAAIIYAEAGNQKQYPVKGTLDGKEITLYKGHLGVGYVIANRMNSRMSYKEVIYKTYQFEPARTGVLTKFLKNPSLISEDCKNAAKVIINDLENGEDSVPKFKRSSFTWQNFWALSYAKTTNFFSVYDEDEYEIMQGHVFFNYTKNVK